MLIVKSIIIITSKMTYSAMDIYNFYILVNLKMKSSGILKDHCTVYTLTYKELKL